MRRGGAVSSAFMKPMQVRPSLDAKLSFASSICV
jgi:hypothetical protein